MTTLALRPTPDWTDRDAWQRELDWLRAQPETLFNRAILIEFATNQISALDAAREKTPAEDL